MGRRTTFNVVAGSSELNDEDIERLFSAIDLNKNGLIEKHELADSLRHLGLACGPEVVEALLARIDRNQDGVIHLEEFKQFIRLRAADIREAWCRLRHDELGGDRPLTSAEVRVAVERAGMKISDDQLRAFMALLDRNGDGTISLEEFKHGLMLVPDVNPVAVFDDFVDATPFDAGGSSYEMARDARRGQDSDTWPKVGVKLTAGGIAGAVSRTCTAPLDRLRSLLQAAPPGSRGCGFLQVARTVLLDGGVLAFFRGNGVNCAKIAPETAAKFFLFERFKQALAADPENVTLSERFVSGGCAGMAAQALIYPLEVVKTRMAVSRRGTYGGVWSCVRTIHASEGPVAFYKGLGPSLAGVMPYAAIDLATSSVLREAIRQTYQGAGREPEFSVLLSCGMVRVPSALPLLAGPHLTSLRPPSPAPRCPPHSPCCAPIRSTS